VSLNEADPAALVERNRVAVEHVVNAINRATTPASEEAATNGKGTTAARRPLTVPETTTPNRHPGPNPHEAKGTAQPVESSETNEAGTALDGAWRASTST